MNAGVSITPCPVSRRPRRASPLRARISKRGCMGHRARLLRHCEHRIAVAEEPVPSQHGVRVSREHVLPPGEGAHEHKQRRLRQMKVREQGIDDSKVETLAYEERCLT